MPTAGADGLLATEDRKQNNSIPMRSALAFSTRKNMLYHRNAGTNVDKKNLELEVGDGGAGE